MQIQIGDSTRETYLDKFGITEDEVNYAVTNEDPHTIENIDKDPLIVLQHFVPRLALLMVS